VDLHRELCAFHPTPIQRGHDTLGIAHFSKLQHAKENLTAFICPRERHNGSVLAAQVPQFQPTHVLRDIFDGYPVLPHNRLATQWQHCWQSEFPPARSIAKHFISTLLR